MFITSEIVQLFEGAFVRLLQSLLEYLETVLAVSEKMFGLLLVEVRLEGAPDQVEACLDSFD